VTDPDDPEEPVEPESPPPSLEAVSGWKPPDFPDDADFDYRLPEDILTEAPLNPSFLARADAYLEDANAPLVVKRHLPLLMMILGSRIADGRNRAHPLHYFSPGIPFRYAIHATLLGASGHGKGATVDAFFRLIGPVEGETPIFPTYEFKGGSIPSLRGGVPSASGAWWVRPGSIERTDGGFLHVPEFTQLSDLEASRGGEIQAIISWADTGKMSYDTISGGSAEYDSSAVMIVGLQIARLAAVEEVVLGWNRRSVYDSYAPPPVDETLPENRLETRAGDPVLLRAFREAVRSAIRHYAPERLDFTPFRNWLSEAYKNHRATATDEQMLYSIVVGYHVATGSSWTGTVEIGVPPALEPVLERILWYKRLARVNPKVRAAHDALYVLEDPYVLGQDAGMREYPLIRLLAARLSIPEDFAREALEYLLARKFVWTANDEDEDSGDLIRKFFLYRKG